MSKRDIKAKPRLIFFHGRWECGYISVRNGIMYGACDLDGTGWTPAEAYNRWHANNTGK